MTYPERSDFMRSYQAARRVERSALEEIETLRSEAERVSQALSGMPPGNGDGQAIPRAVERILEAQHQLEADAAQCAAARQAVQDAIGQVTDPLRRDILRRRYILGQRWERIAADNNLVMRQVFRLHHRAVDELEVPQINGPKKSLNVT